MISDRRQAIRLLGLAAMMPVIASSWSRLAQAQTARFSPPHEPMRFTRTLTRSLPDGAQIVVKRSWQVTFRPVPTGFIVEGRQIAVKVDAPPALAGLARLEEQRDGSSLLPLTLDSRGMIAGPANPVNGKMLDQAVAKSTEKLRAADLSQDEALQARLFMAALQQSADQMCSQLPRDLFAPLQAEWHEERDITLSPISSGTISVAFSARRDPAGQMMEQAERHIVTTIGQTSKTSSEIWELRPL